MVIGQGYADRVLSEAEIAGLVTQALGARDLIGQRVLVIIPDTTRSAPINLFFRLFHEQLWGRVDALDYLVALGTHPSLDEAAINRLVGVTPGERRGRYAGVRIFNHAWDSPSALVSLGVIPAQEIGRLTGGLMCQDVDVTLNRLILDYDLLLICGPTFPHEVVGFSGGNKYFFPGISGPQVINFTHWLGAVITSYAVIGTPYTPVRAVIDRAAAMIDRPKLCFSLVVAPSGQAHAPTQDNTPPSTSPAGARHAPAPSAPTPALAGLYIGAPEEAYAAAAALSSRVHIQWLTHPFRRVLSVMPRMYDDIWTAAKGMYKLEPAVAVGGEVVIYAPHITEFSYTHGALILTIGYHCRDYFLKQWERFKYIPGGVLAHSTHLRGLGAYDVNTGIETDRIRVTLATAIPRALCEQVNLGYLDPAAVQPEEWAGREEEGILLVPRAGEMLYRVKE
jgi:nickel-dependent lactate racemase